MYYKKIELKEGALVQYVGVYVTRMGEPPDVGFVEDDKPARMEALLERALFTSCYCDAGVMEPDAHEEWCKYRQVLE